MSTLTTPIPPVVAASAPADPITAAPAQNNPVLDTAYIDPALLAQAEYNNLLTTPSATDVLISGTVSLDTQTLELLNDVGSQADIPAITASEQLQAALILQEDAQRLEAPVLAPAPAPLKDEAATVELSTLAQVLTEGQANANTQDNTALTPQQQAQLAQIVAPYANQPLSDAVLTQIQTQLALNQISPSQLSLNLLLQSLIAGLQPSNMSSKPIAVRTETKLEVAPVGEIDRVGVESNAILA